MRLLSLLILLLVATVTRAQVVIPEGAQNQLAGILVVSDSFTNKGSFWLSDAAYFYFQGNNWQEANARNTYGRGLVVFNGSSRQQIGGSLRLYRMVVNNAAGVELSGRLAVDSALYLEAGLTDGKSLYTAAASWVIRTGGSMSHAPQGEYNVLYPQYQPIRAGAELEGSGLKDVRVDNIGGVAVSRNLAASGKIAGIGTLVFEGSSRQTLQADGGFALGQLFVQNAAGLGLLSPGIVSNMLRLDGGKLLLQNQVLTLGTDASIEGYDRNHYIVAGSESGRLRRNAFQGSQVFPLGTSDYYLPVTVTHTDAAPFALGVFQGLTVDGKAGTAEVGHKSYMVDAVWITEAPAAGSSVRMEWPKKLEGTNFVDLENEQVGLWVHQNGWKLRSTPPVSVWKQRSTLTTVVSGNARYAVGILDSVVPVLNINLQGKVVLDKTGVSLNWMLDPWRIKGGTLLLEHSTDGVSFQPIHQTAAIGMPLYTFVHQIPVKGLNYYRVTYVSPIGVQVSSAVEAVTYLDSHDQLEVFPNPTTGPVTLRVLTPNAGTAPVTIYNMLGRVVQTSTVALKAGANLLQTDLSRLPAAMYLIKVRNMVVKVERLHP